MSARNPFTPNFGQVPLVLAGRDRLIDEVENAFDNAPGDPSLTSIFIGARGTGKTALLSLLANAAESRGWISVNVPCVPGMLEEIAQGALAASEHLVDHGGVSRLTALSVGQLVGAQWENEGSPTPTWRLRMASILDTLQEHGVGLLITVDEVRPELDEMRLLASYYQLFVREERRISLLMAGLPSEVSQLLNDRSVSFLRRASQYHLGSIGDVDAEVVLSQTARAGEKEYSGSALGLSVGAAQGFPFMLQLIGYRSWQAAPADRIDEDVARLGVERASVDLKQRVLKATLDELSDVDLAFLEAMLVDGHVSATSDIAKRMGKDANYVSQYRRRLVERGIIGARGRGKVAFEMPLMREYLPEYLEG